jgi:lipopolysaccharide transport LptD-like protein
MKRIWSILVLGATLPLPLTAQQQPSPPQDRNQVVRERLRTMGREAPRDTVTNPDSIRARAQRARADSLAAKPRPTAPVDMQRDSLMQVLARLQGFTATEYKGASARFIADSGTFVLTAQRDTQAAVVQGGQSMVADSLLTYDRDNAIACGFGKPVLTGEGADSPVKSEQVCYNTKTRVGRALDATTNVNEGGNWIMFGNLTTSDTDLYIDHGRFTDCTLEVPHYHFAAKEVKVVNKDVLVARNVTLKFGDVPVFWLPFLMQSMKEGRRSGILMPEFSVNDIVRRNSGYNRRISNLGFYWATSQYVGTKVAFGWFADNWTSLDGAVDFRVSDKFLAGGLNWREYWPSEGGRQRTISGSSSWQPDERTSLNANVGYASQSRFVREGTFNPRELNRSIDSNISLSRRFDWAQVTMGGQRQQRLSDESVDWAAPGLNISFAPVTLFNGATWTASAGTAFRRHTNEESVVPEGFDRDVLDGNASSSFSFGNLSWSQGFIFHRLKQNERPLSVLEKEGGVVDTVASFVPSLIEQRMDWNTSLSYQQRLIGTSTFTPGVTMSGGTARDSATGMIVAGPMRLSANAGVKVDLFGFWPGVGPLERLRHRLSPTFSYSYSPATTPTLAQQRVFGPSQIGEQNRLTIGLSQTIEGKFREDKTSSDSAAVDPTATPTDPSEPRRLQQGRRITLLSLNTDAVVYDFVQARDGFGVQTTQISNSINSDLLRGLQLSVTHQLFRDLPLPEGAPTGTRADRVFKPHLSNVNASFSLNGDSWLFRALGLGRAATAKPAVDSTTAAPPTGAPAQTGALVGAPGLGMFGTSGQPVAQAPRNPAGAWNASFNYTLFRPRDALTEGNQLFTASQGNQMVSASVMFQPTANWNVSWNTGYSFTDQRFTDHMLTLTRSLHDWDANFNFVKAQNGNFSFVFHVALRANPDLKFDYRQRANSTGQIIR